MELARMATLLILQMVLLISVSCDERNVAGVSHITLTVSNLTTSTYFYTKILGGMLADDLSSLKGTSDAEYVKMFTGEIEEQQTMVEYSEDKEGCTLTRNISTQWKVYWASVIFDNIMIQLVEYESLKDVEQGADIPLSTDTNLPDSPMTDMMATKIAFWVWDSVNLTEYAAYLEQESHKHGLNKVRFMRPLLLSNTAGFREANQGVRELRDEDLKGLSIGYASGPDGENLKFIQLIDSSKQKFGKHYCKAKMVSSALLDTNMVDKCGEYKNGNGAQLYGVNHISITTTDVNRTLSYLVDTLGGYFIEDIQPSHMQSPSLSKLLLSNLKMPGMTGSEASAELDSKMKAKMLNILSGVEVNLRYILLGNLKVEVAFLTGLPTGMNGMMDNMPSMVSGSLPSASFSKPGYTEIAFLFRSEGSLVQFANSAGGDNTKADEAEADEAETDEAEADEADEADEAEADETDEADEADEAEKSVSHIHTGPLQGLTYTLILPPNKQRIRVVHFSGASKRLLHNSLREYGSVHATLTGMNPWEYDGYHQFCGLYTEQTEA